MVIIRWQVFVNNISLVPPATVRAANTLALNCRCEAGGTPVRDGRAGEIERTLRAYSNFWIATCIRRRASVCLRIAAISVAPPGVIASPESATRTGHITVLVI